MDGDRWEEDLMDRFAELQVTEEVRAQLASQLTPVRIEDQAQTYYVLSAEQLLALLQIAEMSDPTHSFAPADFGLTEEDVTTYLHRRQQRQQGVDSATAPLSLKLQAHLETLRMISNRSTATPPIDEQTLQTLEQAMLHNLQIIRQSTGQ